MTIRFVILSQPRTGSTLLCSLLNSHPGVRVLVEPINPKTHSHHMKPIIGSNCLLPEVMVHNNIQRAFNILFSPEPPPSQWIQSNKRGDVAAGFKIMAHQLQGLHSEGQFWRYLVTEKIKVVLCLRDNILMQYVSDLITKATHQSACWDGHVKTARVTVNVKTLGAELNRIMRERRYLVDRAGALHLNRVTIKYEDFKDDTRPAGRVLKWLIGETVPLSTRLSKQNPDGLLARVVNYDEMAAEVHKLKLAHLLVDSA